jgi:hypothetical protein
VIASVSRSVTVRERGCRGRGVGVVVADAAAGPVGVGVSAQVLFELVDPLVDRVGAILQIVDPLVDHIGAILQIVEPLVLLGVLLLGLRHPAVEQASRERMREMR